MTWGYRLNDNERWLRQDNGSVVGALNGGKAIEALADVLSLMMAQVQETVGEGIIIRKSLDLLTEHLDNFLVYLGGLFSGQSDADVIGITKTEVMFRRTLKPGDFPFFRIIHNGSALLKIKLGSDA